MVGSYGTQFICMVYYSRCGMMVVYETYSASTYLQMNNDDIPTSCMLSVIIDNFPLIKTGYWCIPFRNLMREFESRLESLVHDLQVDSIPITMSNTWEYLLMNMDNSMLLR